MGRKLIFKILTFVIIFILNHCQFAFGITCYTCTNCDDVENIDPTECRPFQNRCIKLVMVNGEIDRFCSDAYKCGGGRMAHNRRARRSEDSNSPKPKIQIPINKTEGEASNQNETITISNYNTTTNDDDDNNLNSNGTASSNSIADRDRSKRQSRNRYDDHADRELSELHCCADEECNGGLSLKLSSSLALFYISYLGIKYLL